MRSAARENGRDLERRLAAIGTAVSFSAGRTIIAEGEPADRIFLVAAGLARKSAILPDGRRHILDFLGRGEVFGFGVDGVSLHLVEAETNLRCIRAPRAAVAQLPAAPGADEPLLLALAERRLARCERKLVAMGCLTSVERVAQFLTWLADATTPADGADRAAAPPAGAGGCDADRPAAAGSVLIPMTRRGIADFLGLTLETVCRAFTRLKELGLIEMPCHSRFIVRDRGALDAFILGEPRF